MLRTSAWATDGRCCRRRLLSLSSLEQTVFWQKVEQILGNERRLYSGSDDNPGELANELPKPGLVAMEAWWRSSPFQLSRRCRNRDSLLHACEFDAHHGQDLRRYCSRAALCTGRKRSRHHGNTPEFSKNTFYPWRPFLSLAGLPDEQAGKAVTSISWASASWSYFWLGHRAGSLFNITVLEADALSVYSEIFFHLPQTL